MRQLSTKGVFGSDPSTEEDEPTLLPSTPSLPLRSGGALCCGRVGVGGVAGGIAAALILLSADAGSADKAPALLDFTARLPPQVIYNYGESETPRSAAMGGALRALGSGTSAVLLNPAAMAETRVYHVGALVQGAPQTRSLSGASTVVDSVTGRLAGGVSFAGGIMDPNGLDRSFIETRVALAYPISERLFVGLGGRYVKITQLAASTPFSSGVYDKPQFEQDKVSGGLINKTTDPQRRDERDPFINALTFDAGLTLKLGDGVFISAVGQNLTYPNHGLLPTTAGGGLGFSSPTFSIEADGLADFSSWGKPTARVMVGGEYLVGEHLPIRLGYRFDQGAKLHTLSAGSGYIGTEFAVEASVKQTLSSPGATTLFLSIEYFFEASGLLSTPPPESQ